LALASGRTMNWKCLIAVTLGASILFNVANAQNYQWTASFDLASGAHRNCGSPPWDNFNVEVRGKAFRAVPAQGDNQRLQTITLNLASLNPDGSGTLRGTNSKGASFQYVFEAGSGPRRIWLGNQNNECRYLLAPLLTGNVHVESSDRRWAIGTWRGVIEGYSFGGTSTRTLQIVDEMLTVSCRWGVGQLANEQTQGCTVGASQIHLATSGGSFVDLRLDGPLLRGTFRTPQNKSFPVTFQRANDPTVR
jgi:hypothetical protein